jgi:hypothetical protein
MEEDHAVKRMLESNKQQTRDSLAAELRGQSIPEATIL